MPLRTREPKSRPNEDLLAKLVDVALRGATLIDFYMTDEDGGTLEQVFVIMWRDERTGEYGTHRAIINHELDEATLMWGHYSLNFHKVHVDFLKRIAEET